LTTRYDDPYFQPPADIQGADARAYEEKIVSMLREQLLPSSGPTLFLQAIELRGKRPDTEIIFRYTDARKPGTFAVGLKLWEEEWPTSGAIEYGETLHDAASVGGWIYSAWIAHELEPVDP
jgi:hypothetical protein